MSALREAWITGVGTTAFGRHDGQGALELMHHAARAAMTQAQVRPDEIDGVLCGYATTLPHLMLASLFCERAGLHPAWAHGLQMGGATGAGMLMLARELVRVGRCRRVLVVAGENRLSGQQRDNAIQTLAQVGDADLEVPNGSSVPAYYALLASRYLHETGQRPEDLAGFAVLMRHHASLHPQAHLREPITAEQVMTSRVIASPLRLLDCCPISDGAVAFLVSCDPSDEAPIRMTGAGQAHLHQHVSAIADPTNHGARLCAQRAFDEAGVSREAIDLLAIYDSFTITLALLLEETGFAPRGGAAARLRAGDYALDGRLPLNPHGGLLSFGHSGAAGGMAHVAEAWRQLAGQAGGRQAGRPQRAFVHADGGILSAHVSLILERADAPGARA